MDSGYKVYQLKTYFHTWFNYCYIVVDIQTKKAFIVDPAWELDKITDFISELNVNLVAIFLTHSHYDHINLVDILVKQFNSEVFISKKEAYYYDFSCNNLHMLNDEETIQIGNIQILSLLTPGHTAGSMCYLLSNSLFTGDTIFIEGCGMCDSERAAAQMFESIYRIKSLVPSNVHVYSGHSYGKTPGYTIEHLMKENIYFQFESKENFVKFRMRKNQKDLLDFK